MIGLTSAAFARGDRDDRGGHYRYHEGRYFRDAGWFGLGGLIAGLAIGAYVASLPPRHETIIVNGVPYYYYDGYYYQSDPRGYVVVAPPPVVVEEPYRY
jgi:hypothetical protein